MAIKPHERAVSRILDLLVPDLWVEVYYYFPIRDIVRSRQVCRTLKSMSTLRPIWINAIRNEIFGSQLRLPRQRGPLKDLSTGELEHLAIKAVMLAMNLACPVPRPTSWREVLDQAPTPHIPIPNGPGPPPISHYITQIFFLEGLNGAQWLLTVSAGFRISCWEILTNPVNALAAGRWDSPSAIVDVVVNKTKLHEATFAATFTTKPDQAYSAMIINVSSLESGTIPTFTTISQLASPPGRLRLLRGSFVFFWRRRLGMCTAINWKTGKSQRFLAFSEEINGPPEASKTIEIHGDKLVVVTTEHIYVWDFDDTAEGSDDPVAHHIIASTILSLRDALFKVDSASIIPYYDSWGFLPSMGDGMSVLLRRKNSALDDQLFHYLILSDPPAEGRSGTGIYLVGHALISPHYCTHVAYGASGRGLLLFQRKGDKGGVEEGLSSFDIRGRHGRTGGAVPASLASWLPLSEVALPKPGVISRCTALDFDDVEGRVVVANSEGKISIFDFA